MRTKSLASRKCTLVKSPLGLVTFFSLFHHRLLLKRKVRAVNGLLPPARGGSLLIVSWPCVQSSKVTIFGGTERAEHAEGGHVVVQSQTNMKYLTCIQMNMDEHRKAEGFYLDSPSRRHQVLGFKLILDAVQNR
jgi:hypothetical protein